MRQHQSFKEKNIFVLIFSFKNKFIHFCFTSVKQKNILELHKWFAFKSAGLQKCVSSILNNDDVKFSKRFTFFLLLIFPVKFVIVVAVNNRDLVDI